MSSEEQRQHPNDAELEDFIAGDHPLSKVYRKASSSEPGAPAALDALILRKAEEAVRHMPRRRARWLQPMAVAAALVLSFGVLINIWRDPAKLEQAVPSPGAVAVDSTPDAEFMAPDKLPEVGSGEKTSKRRSDNLSSDRAEHKDRFADTASMFVPDEQEAESVAEESVVRSSRPEQQDKGSYLAAPEPDPRKAEAFSAEAPPAASAAPRTDIKPGHKRQQETLSLESRAPDAPPRQAEPSRSPATPEVRMKIQPQSFSERGAGEPSASGLRESVDDEPFALRMIREMRDAIGHDDISEARTILKRYRARFPQAELPPDLRFLEAQESGDRPDQAAN